METLENTLRWFGVIMTIMMLSTAGFTQPLFEVQKVAASDRQTGDNYGVRTDISGDYAVVSAYREDHNESGGSPMSNAGAAYILERDGSGVWNQVQKIVASDRQVEDRLGWGLSISGDYLAIGAPLEDHDETGGSPLSEAGSVYIFERNAAGIWNQVQKVVASDRAYLAHFGMTLDLSGDYLIVGAHQEVKDASGGIPLGSAGAAYVFERNAGGVWAEVQKLDAADRGEDDEFGISVTISGMYAAVGAFREDEDASGGSTLADAGSVYIFERNASGVWLQEQKVVAGSRGTLDWFGYNVSMSGDRLLVGAPLEDEDENELNTLNSPGSAYVIERDGSGIWNQTDKIVASDREDNDRYGWYLGIDGDYCVIGAYLEDQDEFGLNTMVSAGSGYAYERQPDASWTQLQKFVASDRTSNDAFGGAIALSNSYVISGALNQDYNAFGGSYASQAGAAYIFEACNSTSSITTITACESYLWTDGITYTVSGIYSQTLTNSTGCDSTATLDLTINNASISTTTIVGCDSYLWTDGTNYTVSSIYTQTLTNSAGCDSIATLDLTINNSNASTSIITACDSYLWTDGTTYTASGIYTQLLVNTSGCDSLATLDLTINNSTSSTTIVTACDSYLWTDGSTYSVSGIYTQTLSNSVTCDSIVTLDLTIINSTSSTTVIAACDSYTWTDGITYSASGTYSQTLINSLGCDSLAVLDLAIFNSTSSTTIVTACDAYLWTNGTTYTSTGTYTQILTNSVGCDSIASLELTINSSSSSTTILTACDSYLWTDGVTYTITGIYTQTLLNSVGCDSLATLDLTINNSTSSTTTITACDAYLWTDGTTYTSSGVYTQTLINSVGCDSLTTLDLTINLSTSSTTIVTECDSYTWTDGTSYTTTGVYTQALTNSVGCDSIATLDLTINYSSSSTTIVNECDSYTWTDGITYSVSGVYTQTLTNSSGCDSIATLDLTIPLIDATVSSGLDTLFANASGMNYQWLDCDNGNVILPGETG
ncbi:FG-GAP repeat protein, partial [Crocinitomix catalasitica]|nr:FG-GAP repeat protein [Crocinitomix catalasitica]